MCPSVWGTYLILVVSTEVEIILLIFNYHQIGLKSSDLMGTGVSHIVIPKNKHFRKYNFNSAMSLEIRPLTVFYLTYHVFF